MSIVSKTTKRFSGFNPASFPDCVLWMDAADPSTLTYSGSNVTQWRDKSSNARTLSNAGTITTTTQNGLNVLSMGAGQRMTNASLPWRSFFTQIFVVSGNNGFLISQWGSSFYNMIVHTLNGPLMLLEGNSYFHDSVGAPFTSNAYYMIVIGYNGGNPVTPYTLNGSNRTGAYSTGSGTKGDFTLTSSFWLNGRNDTTGFGSNNLAEFIHYNRNLTSSEYLQIEGYLAQKWGLASLIPASHPFKSVRPFTRPFQPTDISGCALWLDAADRSTLTLSGNNVSTLSDKSGNDRTGTATGTVPYVSNAINGLGGISFTGMSNTFIGGAVSNTGTTVTGFVVATMNASTPNNNARIVSLGVSNVNDYQSPLYSAFIYRNGSSNSVATYRNNAASPASSTFSYDTPVIFGALYDNTSGFIYVNGVGVSYSSTGTFGIQSYRIGSSMNTAVESWYGYAGEVILYNSALTTPQRQQLEGYLARKWGLRTSLPATQPFRLYTPLSVVFTPSQISGLNIWLDAADNSKLTLSGTNVTQWTDKSANGYAFTVTGTNPVFGSTFNGTYPSVRSTNTNTTLSASIPISNVLSATGYSIFAVGKITSGVVFMIMNDATNVWKITDIEYAGGSLVNVKCFSAGANLGYDPRNPFMMSLTYIRGSTFTAYFNGNAAYSASTATAGTLTGNSSFILFYGGTGYGSVSEASEVVVYNTLLSTSQRQAVEGYLAHKWGLVSSLPASHPYKKIRP